MYPHGRSTVGAYDMSGNMYQWCLNEYDHPENLKPSKEPRTTRGGAFFLPPPGAGQKRITEADQLNVHHRLRDNSDGVRDDGRRVAVCIRLACENPPAEAILTQPASR
jgi:formylglycine-generating enzyme required for sulfatase activity